MNKTIYRNPVHYGSNISFCFLDRDNDGLFAELEDCQVCNGSQGPSENQLYVDAVAGNDSGDGSPANPFKTIAGAMGSAAYSGAVTLCLAGTFNETVTLSESGVAETGKDFFSTKVPKNPVAFIGWDKDADGMYPPYDTDDVAILDGENSRQWAFDNSVNGANYIEIAHLTVQNYGGSGSPGGLFNNAYASTREYLFIHDLHVKNINATQSYSQTRVLVNGGPDQINRYYVLWNNNFENIGSSYLNFDSSNAIQDSQSLIRQNYFAFGSPGQNHIGVNIRAHSNVVIEQNYFYDARGTADYGGQGNVRINSCAQSIKVRHNIFREVEQAIRIQPGSGCGAGQDVIDNILIEGNIIEAGEATNDAILIMPQGSTLDETNSVANVDIFSNIVFSIEGILLDGAIWIFTGHTNTGTSHPGNFRIRGNSIIGQIDKAIPISRPSGNTETEFPMNFDLRNNLIDTTAGEWVLGNDYALTTFGLIGNAFDVDNVDYRYPGGPYLSLALFEGAIPGTPSGNTDSCVPTYTTSHWLDSYGISVPIIASTSCTESAGSDVSAVLLNDMFGESRDATDIGPSNH